MHKSGVVIGVFAIAVSLSRSQAVADWPSMAGCIANPAEATSLVCLESDLNDDSFVSSLDTQLLQQTTASVGTTPPCEQLGHWYASATKYLGGVTGVRATMDFDEPTVLCDEPGSTAAAATSTWIGVTTTGPGTVIRWAQTGWHVSRSWDTPPGTEVFVRKYCEILASEPSDYLIQFFPQPSVGASEWTCQLFVPEFGIWEFRYAGQTLLFANIGSGWDNTTGNRADFTCELHNWGNQLPGTATNMHEYTQCGIELNSSGVWQNAQFTDSNVEIDIPSEHHFVLMPDGNGAYVWDDNP